MIPRPEVILDRSWQFPTPREFELRNGMRVWAFDLPGQLLVSATLVTPSSPALEPRELEGLATLAIRCSDEGTAAHPGHSLAEALESQGALIDVDQMQFNATFSLDVPAHRLANSLPLFAEIPTQPAIADEDVTHHKAQLAAEYASARANSRSLTALATRHALYLPSDRRTRPMGGSPDTLQNISAAQVREFAATNWSPTGSVLVVAGVLPGNLIDLVEESFGAWATPAGHADIAPQAATSPRVLVVDRPGAVQADVTIAGLTIPRGDERLPALRVAGHMLAGAFTSRLNLALREEQGFTYGVNGGITPGRFASTFAVSAAFRTEVVAQAITQAHDLLSLTDPFAEAELDAAKDFLLGVGPLRTETAGDIAETAAMLAAGRVTAQYLNAQNAELEGLSAAQVTATYRELINVQDLSLALTGPADVLIPQLEELGLSPTLIEP